MATSATGGPLRDSETTVPGLKITSCERPTSRNNFPDAVCVSGRKEPLPRRWAENAGADVRNACDVSRHASRSCALMRAMHGPHTLDMSLEEAMSTQRAIRRLKTDPVD